MNVLTPVGRRLLSRGKVKDWFAKLYPEEARGSLRDAKIISLEGPPGSQKGPILSRLAKMGFPVLTLSLVQSCVDWAKTHGPLADDSSKRAALYAWGAEWQRAVTSMGQSAATDKLFKSPILFTLRYPPETFRALGVPQLHPGAFSPVTVVDCVCDPQLIKERVAYRLQLAEDRPRELAVRTFFNEQAFLSDPQPTAPPTAHLQLYSTDPKVAVASLLELICHPRPSFQFPPLKKNA